VGGWRQRGIAGVLAQACLEVAYQRLQFGDAPPQLGTAWTFLLGHDLNIAKIGETAAPRHKVTEQLQFPVKNEFARGCEINRENASVTSVGQ
jgi:hypothetical protein